MFGCEVRGVEIAAQVYVQNGVEVLRGCIDRSAEADDPCAVDQDVELPVGVDGFVDHGLGVGPVGDVTAICNGFPSLRDDLIGYQLGPLRIATTAGRQRAQIIDDHLGTLACHPESGGHDPNRRPHH